MLEISRIRLFTFLIIPFILQLLPISKAIGQLPIHIDSLHKALRTEITDTGKARIYMNLAWSNRVDSVSQALEYSQKALDIFNKYNMKLEANRIYNRMGILWRNKGDYNTALEMFYHVLNSQDSAHSHDEIAYAYNNISDIYNRLEKFEKAHEFSAKASQLFAKSKNLKGLAYTLNLKGEIYRNEAKYKEALDIFYKALEIRIQINHVDGMAASYYNIGECFFELNMPDSAIKAYNISTEIFKKAGYRNYGFNYIGFGKYYILLGKYKDALTNLHKALEISYKVNNPSMRFKAAGYLRKVYAHLGDFNNAFKYQTLEVEIIDSLIRKEYLNKITTLELNYNFEQRIKLKEIEQIKNQALYEAKLLEQKIITLGLAFLVVSIVTTILFMYRNYKKVQVLNKNLVLSSEEIEKQKKSIEEQNTELQQLNATKDKLFSIIAHDLKNPFNGIIGISSILQQNMSRMKKEDITELLISIHDAATGAHKLLENLLEWSLTQTGAIDFRPIFITVRYIVMDITSMTASMQEQKKIQLLNEIDENTQVFADFNMLNTILRNLIMNSLKFTPEGGKIWVKCTESDSDFQISVEDTGVGIEEEKIKNLFDMSIRNSTPGTFNEKGTGLGLLLCKEFVAKHNGSLQVQSKIGVGTKFIVVLPKNIY